MILKVDHNTVVAFDLDDTLYNEIDYLKSAYWDIAKQLDKKNASQLFAYMFSLFRCKINVFEYLIANYNTSKDTLLDMYRNHIPGIKPFENSITIIKTIKSKKGSTAIITDGRKKTQLNKIKSLGLIELIDKIIISEEIGSEKPSLKNFKIVEDHFKKNNYVYIADNLKKDFITPNKLGWNTIGLIDNGLNIHQTNHLYFNEEYKPNHFILNYNDISIK